MDRISRHRHGAEMSMLLFTDNVVILAPFVCDLQHSLDRFAAEFEVAGVKISTSSTSGRPWFSAGNQWLSAPSWGWGLTPSEVNHDQKKKIAGTSGQNELPQKGGSSLSLATPLGTGWEGSKNHGSSCGESSQLKWFGHLVRRPPGHLPQEVLQVFPVGVGPRADWDSISTVARWHPPIRADCSCQGKGSRWLPEEAATPATWPRISGWRWMDHCVLSNMLPLVGRIKTYMYLGHSVHTM